MGVWIPITCPSSKQLSDGKNNACHPLLVLLEVYFKSISQFFSETYVWPGLPQQFLFIFYCYAEAKPRACWVSVMPQSYIPSPNKPTEKLISNRERIDFIATLFDIHAVRNDFKYDLTI